MTHPATCITLALTLPLSSTLAQVAPAAPLGDPHKFLVHQRVRRHVVLKLPSVDLAVGEGRGIGLDVADVHRGRPIRSLVGEHYDMALEGLVVGEERLLGSERLSELCWTHPKQRW